jgi:hypothetical protein
MKAKPKCSLCKQEGHNKRGCKTPMISKNAQTARNGNKAELLICKLKIVKELLEEYFGEQIKEITLIPKRKKSDIELIFQSGRREKIQNKDGKGNNRGWSCDRRSVDKYPFNESGKKLLQNVCLKKGTHRPESACPPSIIDDIIGGTDVETIPTYFTHTVFNDGKLLYLSICPASIFISSLKNELYTNLLPKRTCVHISPRIYLQRKGGGKTDHSPDDIQLKLTSLPSGFIQLYSQTMPEQG